MTDTPIRAKAREWVYQLERIAPKVYAKQHAAVVEVIDYLRDALLREADPLADPPACQHGHKSYKVGCVSCVLVHKQWADPVSPAT